LKALAAPLFARMPEGVYREMLVERLARRVSMHAAALKKAIIAAGDTAAGGPARLPQNRSPGVGGEPLETRHSRMDTGRVNVGRPSVGRASAGRGNLLSQAITLVLHHPAAARFVKDAEALGNVSRPGVAVLKELLDQAAGMDRPSTAMLLERWRSRTEYGRLSELAMAAPLVAEEQGAAKELQMAVEKLIEECGPGRRVDELLRKAEELGLNNDEKAELSLLLKAKGRPRAPS
jgi:hypothetical protein